VEADVASLRNGPQFHAATRALAERGVGVLLDVTAPLPTALVPVPRDDPGAPERPAEDVLRLPGLGPHRAALVGEEIRPLEPLEGVFEERDQLLGDANRAVLLVLGF
jgi:hypothetical protein